jgi:hypothetical protein
MDAAMTPEQAKDFYKTAEAMFEYGMSIAAEIADVFNVVNHMERTARFEPMPHARGVRSPYEDRSHGSGICSTP